MPGATLRARPAATRRRWCLPRALLSDPAAPELIPGVGILQEHDAAAGILLWQCYRDVTLWADTPEAARPGLFQPGTDAARAALLRRSRLSAAPLCALEVLVAVPNGEAPEEGCVAIACSDVAAWAAAIGAASTAIGFAQAAAFVLPQDARLALEVGRLAAQFRRNVVADTWLRRAISLARRARDKVTYAGALLEHAWVRLQLTPGDGPIAFQRAIRAARRSGRSEIRALGHYGLARAALGQGDYSGAVTQTRIALRLLRGSTDNRHLALVVLDHAEGLLLSGSQSGAAVVLRRFLPAIKVPRERIRALTMLVRTGGAEGAPPVTEVWYEARMLLDGLGESDEAARALLELSRAGAEIGYHAHADRAARRALAISNRSHAQTLVHECAEFLGRSRRRSQVFVRRPAKAGTDG